MDRSGRWWGLLAPLDRVSGDGRILSTPPDGQVRVRPLPLPLMYQQANDDGHKGAVLVGRVDQVWTADGALWGEGEFNLDDPLAAEVFAKVADGWHRWVSPTTDDYTKEFRIIDSEGAFATIPLEAGVELPEGFRQVEVLPNWRLMSVTLVNEQAFPEATISVGARPVAAAAHPAVEDSEDGEEFRRRTTTDDDPAAADDEEDPAGEQEEDPPEDPEEEQDDHPAADEDEDPAEDDPEQDDDTDDEDDDGDAKKRRGKAVAITAAVSGLVNLTDPDTGQPWHPPASWFTPPAFSGYTRLTVTKDGRVYGHVGHWGAEHLSRPGVRPPSSRSGYAYFLRRAVETDGGDTVKVGTITVGNGHAGLDASAVSAMAHYDSTSTQAAIVNVGEDTHGIWIAGAVLPGLDTESRNQLALADLSGDWRVIGGELEMVGAHGVNTPGFLTLEDAAGGLAEPEALAACVLDGPVMRCGDGGRPYALVAAGMCPRPRPEDTTQQLALSEVVQERMAQLSEAARLFGDQLGEAFRDLAPAGERVARATRAQRVKAGRSRSGQALPVRRAAAAAQARRRSAAQERMRIVRDKAKANREQRAVEVRARVRRHRAVTAAARISIVAAASATDDPAGIEDFNWVEDVGGLPAYVKRIARHLKAKGFTESHAIATAVNVVKKMCANGGDRLNFPGAQRDVNPGSIAQACAAVASWEAKKARARAS